MVTQTHRDDIDSFLRGRPLMIWGWGRRKSRKKIAEEKKFIFDFSSAPQIINGRPLIIPNQPYRMQYRDPDYLSVTWLENTAEEYNAVCVHGPCILIPNIFVGTTLPFWDPLPARFPFWTEGCEGESWNLHILHAGTVLSSTGVRGLESHHGDGSWGDGGESESLPEGVGGGWWGFDHPLWSGNGRKSEDVPAREWRRIRDD